MTKTKSNVLPFKVSASPKKINAKDVNEFIKLRQENPDYFDRICDFFIQHPLPPDYLLMLSHFKEIIRYSVKLGSRKRYEIKFINGASVEISTKQLLNWNEMKAILFDQVGIFFDLKPKYWQQAMAYFKLSDIERSFDDTLEYTICQFLYNEIQSNYKHFDGLKAHSGALIVPKPKSNSGITYDQDDINDENLFIIDKEYMSFIDEFKIIPFAKSGKLYTAFRLDTMIDCISQRYNKNTGHKHTEKRTIDFDFAAALRHIGCTNEHPLKWRDPKYKIEKEIRCWYVDNETIKISYNKFHEDDKHSN